MQIREQGRVQVINANTLKELTVDTAHATGNLDLFPADVDSAVYVLTNNLSGAVLVGLNVRNARKGMKARLTRNSAAPGAFSVTVKSGTAAGGTTLARAIAASRNGFVEAQFDGAAWVAIGFGEHT